MNSGGNLKKNRENAEKSKAAYWHNTIISKNDESGIGNNVLDELAGGWIENSLRAGKWQRR